MKTNLKTWPQPTSNIGFPNIGDYQAWKENFENEIIEKLNTLEQKCYGCKYCFDDCLDRLSTTKSIYREILGLEIIVKEGSGKQ